MLELFSDLQIPGVDEAGRGTMFGSLVAAAVIMPMNYADDDKLVHEIKDSKKVSPKKRKKLAEYIKNIAIAYGIGVATAQEVDIFNVLQADYLAMHRALDEVYLKMKFKHIYVDGSAFKPYIAQDELVDGWIPFTCVVDGDAKYLNIAAASILAKTHHDELIEKMLNDHPEWKEKYGFETNQGYGTKKHFEGLERYGITSEHRKSFNPIKKYL